MGKAEIGLIASSGPRKQTVTGSELDVSIQSEYSLMIRARSPFSRSFTLKST